jgi:hypothetical protein
VGLGPRRRDAVTRLHAAVPVEHLDDYRGFHRRASR